MKKFLIEKNVRVRCKKTYAEAHTHVLIGKVIEETENYVAVKGRTFHFRRITSQMRSQIYSGETMIRVIPWDNIEIIHWISEKADWEADIGFDANGNLILKDKAHTVISMRQDDPE